MNKVSRSPLRAFGRGPAKGFARLLRAHAALALAFTLLASLAPLGTSARAQAPSKYASVGVEDGPAYLIYQTPDGEVTCRLATPEEMPLAGERPQPVLRQINHLRDKESAAESASAGLIIVLRATARLDANPEAKAAFIAAAAKWEALISSQITVTIDVDYGPDFFENPNQPYGENTLGLTSQSTYIVPYANVRQRLLQRAPSGSEEAAIVNNLPATSFLPTDLGNVSEATVTRAQMSALGLAFDPNTQATIPKIGFNTKFGFDLNPDNGVNPALTDFDSVAVHEIGHALGFGSRVGGTELPTPLVKRASIWDFYRFRPGGGPNGFSTAARVLSSGTSSTDQHVYFSGGTEVQLSTGKPDGTGGDGQQSSHWKDNTQGRPFIGIMDPTIPSGRHDTITANDLRAIDYFGYTLAGVTPPPPPPGPANDNFANAQALPGSSGSVAGTNANATSEGGEPNHSPDNDAGGKSVWYNWTAPSNGPVTFTTAGSNYDTVLAAYAGASVGGLSAIAKNDDVQAGQIITSSITFTAAGGTTYRVAVDGWNGEEGAVVLNWSHTSTGGGQTASVQFGTASLSIGEAGGRATLNVTRTGSTAGAVTVDYRTTDSDAFTVGCADAVGANGNAFARCDFATAAGTLRFNAGETTKSITVPIIDDGHDEATENFQVRLSDPSGGTLGTPSIATVSVVDNDGAGAQNPVTSSSPFFVRQQYLDFLSREPDDAGLNAWLGVLNGCANINTGPEVASGCDRIFVSGEGFFRSDEFRLKGFYVFRFYKVAFNRLPEYTEVVSDMSFVAGATAEEVFARRAELATRFANRQEFATAYGGLSNAQYVAALLGRYGLTQVTTPDPANPDTGGKVTLTAAALAALPRDKALRAIADSDQVGAVEFNGAFVAMQYYGYLRRKPEPSGYDAWLQVLQSGDTRTMVNGFLNSTEYKLRFGQP